MSLLWTGSGIVRFRQHPFRNTELSVRDARLPWLHNRAKWKDFQILEDEKENSHPNWVGVEKYSLMGCKVMNSSFAIPTLITIDEMFRRGWKWCKQITKHSKNSDCTQSETCVLIRIQADINTFNMLWALSKFLITKILFQYFKITYHLEHKLGRCG